MSEDIEAWARNRWAWTEASQTEEQGNKEAALVWAAWILYDADVGDDVPGPAGCIDDDAVPEPAVIWGNLAYG